MLYILNSNYKWNYNFCIFSQWPFPFTTNSLILQLDRNRTSLPFFSLFFPFFSLCAFRHQVSGWSIWSTMASETDWQKKNENCKKVVSSFPYLPFLFLQLWKCCTDFNWNISPQSEKFYLGRYRLMLRGQWKIFGSNFQQQQLFSTKLGVKKKETLGDCSWNLSCRF